MSHKYDHMRKLLHDACMLNAIEDLKAFPPDEEIAKMHEFSPEFLRNMEKMMDEVFNKKKKPDAAAIKKRRIAKFKKISAAAAISVAFIFSCAMSVTAVREAFINMLVSVVGDDFFTGSVNMFILEYRAPRYIPKDYNILKTEETDILYKILYQKDDNIIRYYQRPLSFLSDIMLDYKENESISVEIDGFTRIFYSPDKNSLVLSDNEYCYVIQANLELEELVKISDSISTVTD